MIAATREPRFASMPPPMRERDQWVMWLQEQREGKFTKVPYRIDGRRASSTDQSTWTTFDNVVLASQTGRFSGIGFALSPPFVGIDLDKAIRDDGDLEPWASEIITSIDSYTERSVSARGFHIICRGKLPAEGRRRGHIEMYASDRFFVMTGRHVAGTPLTVEERSAAVNAAHAKFIARPEVDYPRPAPVRVVDVDDQNLVRRMLNARNGNNVGRLWHGNTSAYGDDHSASDAALVAHLAFWTGNDPDRIDRLFRMSALYRSKWDERRGDRTYGQVTIDFVVSRARSTYSPSEAR
jgi:putative DNA primase/helicase